MSSDTRRKMVTAVFTDLVESTSMAERLDPEALSAVLAGYFAVARSTVEQHGGTVEKFIGDAVVAMFGIEELREDDALRAVRTAVELRDAVERLNDDLEPAFGVRLRLRTGINTGEVVVAAASADSLAVGHAISMAARLEQAAGPGEIVVGEETYRLAHAGLAASALEPLAVKGSSAPLAAWRVDGLVAPPVRGWHSGGTYLGRTAELDEVAAAYRATVAERRSSAALIVAPPGFGKTRFAAEVTARLEPAPRVVLGRTIADGGSTYGAIVDILAELGGGAEAGIAGALEPSLAPLADAPQVARAARALVAGTGVATTDEVAWVVRRVSTALTMEAPLVVVLDDLHWADPLLLDVVAKVVQTPIEAPVFVLGLTRPELLEDQAEWLARIPDVQTVRLQPLTPEETQRLVADRLGSDADADQRRRIVEAAAGVPLFVEQWAALDAETADKAVPSTIRALMAARVDRIAGDARIILETAAIAGEAFSREDVAGLVSEFGLDNALAALKRREILRQDAAVEGGYRFGHALLRDAVVDAMPRRRRAELHERRTSLLEASDPVDLERVGFHLEAAWLELTAIGLPDAHTTDLAGRAARVLAVVGGRSLARKEWHRAVGLLRRAEQLVVREPMRSAILPDLIDALVQAGELDAADEAHAEALRIAAGPLDRARADVAWGGSLYIRRLDNWPERVLEVTAATIPVFEAAGDETWLARANVLRFYTSINASAEIETLKEARAHAERAGDERSLIEVWDQLGGAMVYGPTPFSEVLEFMRAEVAWARERGVAFTEADGLLGEAYAVAGLGDVEAARDRIATVRGLFEALPSVVSQLGEMWLIEAALRRDAGDLAGAAEAIERAIEVFESCGETGWARISLVWLALANLDLGRPAAASSLLERTRSGRVNPPWFQALVTAGDARVALANGDTDRARQLALGGSGLIDASSTQRNAIRALEELGDVLAATGDVDAAKAQFEEARRRAAAKEDRVAELRLRTRLDGLAPRSAG